MLHVRYAKIGTEDGSEPVRGIVSLAVTVERHQRPLGHPYGWKVSHGRHNTYICHIPGPCSKLRRAAIDALETLCFSFGLTPPYLPNPLPQRLDIELGPASRAIR